MDTIIKIEDIKQEKELYIKQEREDVGANQIKSIQQRINPIFVKEEKKSFEAVDNYCFNCFNFCKVKVRHIQGYKCIIGQPEEIKKSDQKCKVKPPIFTCSQCNKRCYSYKKFKKHKAKFHLVYCTKNLPSIKDNLEEFTKKYTTALNDTSEEIKFNIPKNLKTYTRKIIPKPFQKVEIQEEPKCIDSDSRSVDPEPVPVPEPYSPYIKSSSSDPEPTNNIKFEIKEEPQFSVYKFDDLKN